ncbi:MAG: hypothetical protein HYV26_10605, partial [Candidatus Hydrogenedentes bacterium]|nr:hypothetical protein [Candidatus Hydrogenedentota bacterium]
RLEQRPTAEDRTRAAIDSHQAAIDADPNSPDTPALLNAMGNLYRQKLRDYQSAAEAYQRIIIDYPTWDGAYGVYPQLEVCYEQLLDHEGLIWLYETMMKRFPAEAQEYKYAQQQLGLPETPTPPAPAEEAAPEAGAATAEGEPSPPETETPPAALAPS